MPDLDRFHPSVSYKPLATQSRTEWKCIDTVTPTTPEGLHRSGFERIFLADLAPELELEPFLHIHLLGSEYACGEFVLLTNPESEFQ